MDEDTPKRRRYDTAAEDTDGASEDILPWLSVDVDTLSQLMELLDDADDALKGSVNTPTKKVRFIDDPYSSPSIFQSSSSYVTINGNEESCGSSFSDSDSSVMASVYVGSIRRQLLSGEDAFSFGECSGKFQAEESAGARGSSKEAARGWTEKVESTSSVVSGEGEVRHGCDVFDWDEQTLAKFLGEDYE